MCAGIHIGIPKMIFYRRKIKYRLKIPIFRVRTGLIVLFLPRYRWNVNDHKFCDEGKVTLRSAINRSMSVFCGEREKTRLVSERQGRRQFEEYFFPLEGFFHQYTRKKRSGERCFFPGRSFFTDR